MTLLFKTVEFQTGSCSFGIGVVVEVNYDTEEVKVLEDGGDFWRGQLDQVSLSEND
ncbi:hypothetical protein RGV33_33000 [Pseudomonas sp. Bout1]|uniref:hypothetical protein n=1 Tax=Pseudomonas sp. Bout1 TaxID=3048600 RepID=UPI002AB43B65|nr:hypothetical protein [Pseudomonas sp. Bout1]MDY7536442.1 hypothetical protein [Pseudomonas sp. Bout1]MEB0187495.1 hypothetical protein [Pseudomonas sp. Bout1]